MPEASGSGVADESDYSIFENKTGLAEDMKFLASMPELCDVTFLVGETREPVCAVKAVLAARSRVFHKLLYQAPSPQRKKEPQSRENKIRLFLKRSSEPLLNLQNAAQQRSGFTQQLAPIQEPQPNQHHTLIVEEFEPDVFRQLIQYIHTGCVTLQPRTLLGVMNAADYYGLDELRRACAGFVQCCITVDTVCALLASAERYIQYKCTKSLVQKVLEFVDEHGNEVLNLGSFTLLPQHVVRLILAREELRADEFTKFQAALMWSKKYCDSNQTTGLKEVISNFLEYIQFYKIPTNVLMKEVNPLGLVPSEILINAVAYQADPTSVDPGKLSPHRVRRQGRSMSVQSSLDPYGSNTTLSSSGSEAGSDQKQHSGKSSAGEQETPREQQRQLKLQKQREEEEQQRQNELRSQLQQRQEQEEEARRHQQEVKKQQEEDELRRQQLEGEARKQEGEEELQQQRGSREGLTKDGLREQQEEPKKEKDESKSDGEKGKEGQEVQRQQQDEIQKQQEEEVKSECQEMLQELQAPQQEKELEIEQRKENLNEKQQDQSQERLGEQQLEAPQQQDKEQKQEERESRSHVEDQAQQSKESQEQQTEDKVQIEIHQSQNQLESQEQPKEEDPRTKEELQRQAANDQRRARLQLHLENVRKQLEREELMQQRQEEALRRAIQERRFEEELESQQPQQLQLCLEGRKPESEKTLEQQQQQRQGERTAAKKTERVKIRVDDSEVRKQKQQQQLQEQQPGASVEPVSGFYIRLVVKQEGRANLVWLLKTHMF